MSKICETNTFFTRWNCLDIIDCSGTGNSFVVQLFNKDRQDIIPGLLVGEHVLEVLAHLVEKLVVDVLLLVGGLVAVVGGEDLVRGQDLAINNKYSRIFFILNNRIRALLTLFCTSKILWQSSL